MIVIDEPLLDSFRNAPCELCGRRPASPHHLWAKGAGGGSRLDLPINLIALCPPCHQNVHAGNIPRSLLLLAVARRERTTPGKIQDIIWKMRRTPGTLTLQEAEKSRTP